MTAAFENHAAEQHAQARRWRLAQDGILLSPHEVQHVDKAYASALVSAVIRQEQSGWLLEEYASSLARFSLR